MSGELDLDNVIEGIIKFKESMTKVNILEVSANWWSMKLEIRYIGKSGGEYIYICDL